jgi:polyhydroxybutyrate depolymerase
MVTACSASAPAATSTAGSPSAGASSGTDIDGTLQTGNLTRSYVPHLPPPSSRLRPTPIVVVFHGYPMTAGQISRITHLSKLADAHGFAVVFPQGYGQSWAVPGGSTPAQQAGIDDVAFVRAMIDLVGRTNDLDTSRVVATGISNGGIFTELLGCAMADRLIAIVPVAGLMRRDTAARCAPARPLSVLAIHGTGDPIADYNGVPGTDGFLSFTETLGFWARLDHCSAAATSTKLADTAHDNTSVSTFTYSGCGSGAEVSGDAVNGGGHAWPGGEPVGSVDEMGLTSMQFDTGELIWSLLERHH